jgi:uncharacterized protein YaaQ
MIVADEDADRLVGALVGQRFPATKIGSTGGFLRRGNATILSGVDESEVEAVIAVARRECRARTEYLPVQAVPFAGESVSPAPALPVRMGGAIIFVLPVERFEKT